MGSPLLLEPPLLLPHDVGGVHRAPLERRVRLGDVRRDADGDRRGAPPVGLALLAQRPLHHLADTAHLGAEPDDLAHVRLVLGRQADHEVELHPGESAREDALGGLQDLRQGDVLVDDVAHPLAAGLRGEGDARGAHARQVVEDVLVEPVGTQGRDAERDLLRDEPARDLPHERRDARVVRCRERREAHLVRAAASDGAHHRLDDGLRIALAHGAVNHPPWQNRHPSVHPRAISIEMRSKIDLGASYGAVVREGPGVQALDQRPFGRATAPRRPSRASPPRGRSGRPARLRRATGRRPPPARPDCAGGLRAALRAS